MRKFLAIFVLALSCFAGHVEASSNSSLNTVDTAGGGVVAI